MKLICNLLEVARLYARHEGIADATASKRIFDDGKRLRLLGSGATITVARYETAMAWLFDRWPDGLTWPTHVPRPS